jgi:DNA-binding MarR family transcriptional regulator
MPQTSVISYTDPTLDRWARLMRTRNLLYKMFTRDLMELGIKPEQLGILNILKKAEGPVTPSFISRVYRREPHTISVNLRRLEGKGLIKLSKDLARRNMIHVEITDAGASVWEKGVKRTSNVGQAFRDLSDVEMAQFDSVIDKIAQTAQQLLKRSEP